MAIVEISNSESAESVRDKLNALISAVNTIMGDKEFGTTAVQEFQTDLAEIRAEIVTLSAKNALIVQRKLSGEQDGENKVFNTPEAFVSGSTRLYLNGQKLTIDKDYAENENLTGVTFVYAPEITDELSIEYIPFE